MILFLFTKAPKPFNPKNLCGAKVIKSTLLKSTYVLPIAWVASVWNTQSGYSFTILAISSIGCIVPSSLSTLHILTSIVSLLIVFFNSSKSILPSLQTDITFTSNPKDVK